MHRSYRHDTVQRYLIGFGTPSSSGEPFPAAPIYYARVIEPDLNPCKDLNKILIDLVQSEVHEDASVIREKWI